VPVTLTLEQVIENRLPTAIVDKEDKRKHRWQTAFAPPLIEAGLLTQAEVDRGGLAQVEIDALAAIRPEVLRRYADAAIAPFLDPTLLSQAAQRRADWEREANEALARGVDRAKLDTLSAIQRFVADRYNSLSAIRFRALDRIVTRSRESLDALEAAIAEEVRRVELPPVPETPEPEDRSETVAPLVDSDWSHFEMIRALKARKKYDED
jgi:hypothetical protein